MSYRWIDFCIDRKQIVRDLKKECLPHLLPWVHSMPFESFCGYRVVVKGFSIHNNYVLRQITELLGGVFIHWKNRESVEKDHKVIFLNPKPKKFKEKVKKDEVIKKLGLVDTDLLVKDMSWIFKTANSGKIDL